jgi:hypothetical protein
MIIVYILDVFSAAQKIYEWMQTAWGQGTALFILFLLTFTDVFKTIANSLLTAFASIFKKKEPEELWSKRPIRKKLIWPVIGIIKFQLKRKHLRNYIESDLSSNKSAFSYLFETEENHNDFQFEFNEFKSRKSLSISDKFVSVICGIPGTGKTSYINHYISKRLESKNIGYIIRLNDNEISTKFPELLKPITDESIDIFWKITGNVTLIKPPKGSGLHSPILISYIFNYKPTTIIIEDVVEPNHLQYLIENLKQYFEKFHSGNKHIKIIISTRIRQTEIKLSDIDIQTLTIPALNKEEIQTFFYKNCQILDILNNENFNRSVAPKESILHFNHPLTQTPLFVEIVVYMLYQKRNELIDENYFSKSVFEIFEKFVKTLYDRRNTGETPYEKFHVLYRELAYKAWTNGNIMDITLINSIFNESGFSIPFLETNGFIIKRNNLRANYSFIHNSLIDILFIEYIVTNKEYKTLSSIPYLGEEYTYYLQEKISNLEEYRQLTVENLILAGRVLNRMFFDKIKVKSSYQTGEDIMKDIFRAHLVSSNKNLDSDAFKEMYYKLSNQWPDLENYFIKQINTTINDTSLKAALVIQSAPINQAVLKIFYNKNYEKLFIDEFEAGYLKLDELFYNALKEVELNTDNQNYLLCTTINAKPIGGNKDRYEQWFLAYLHKFNGRSWNYFLANPKLKNIILTKYQHTNIDHTLAISKMYDINRNGEILIPKGIYTIEKKSVINPATIVVSRKPNVLLFKENNMYEAEMEGLNKNQCRMWTYEQLQIAYAYFTATQQNFWQGIRGIGDPTLDQGVLYEAYKINNIGKVQYAFLKKENENALITSTHASFNQSKFIENILFREVLYLGPSAETSFKTNAGSGSFPVSKSPSDGVVNFRSK